MNSVWSILLLVSVFTLNTHGRISEQAEIYYLKGRIRIAIEMLQENCPQLLAQEERFMRLKRALSHELKFQFEIRHLREVMRALSGCSLIPEQCTRSETLNLTEPWRKELNVNNMQGTYDPGHLDGGRVWFRFTGAAGDMLLNRCPPAQNSCGSNGPHWSDSPMPNTVGQSVNITIYESYWNPGQPITKCRNANVTATVTRCSSAPGDFVYKMTGNMTGGSDTVCGMVANNFETHHMNNHRD